MNISYPRSVDQIDEYLDASIIPTSVRFIISRDKEINNKKKNKSKVQGGDIIRILRKNNLDGKWLTICVNEEQHLPYWKLLH